MFNEDLNYKTKLIRRFFTVVQRRSTVKLQKTEITEEFLVSDSGSLQFRILEIKLLVKKNILSVLRKAISMSSFVLPLFIQGEVVKGFGRGSKDLGCPTANYSLEVVQSLPKNLEPGVYYGWAQVDNGPVLKMVANVGWCPFYANKQMSVETHIMHKFEGDFYGSNLRICLLGYLRDEKNFSSLDDLIKAIKQDIANAEQSLESPDAQNVKANEYFSA